MALTKITPQMFDTSAAGHDFNIDNGTFVVDASANRVGIGTATPSTLLDVNGTATATTFVGALSGNVTGNLTGTILTAAQTNITSVGTLSSLTVSGALNGTLSTAAQPNITSVGSLTHIQVLNGGGSVGGTTPRIYSSASATLDISTNSARRLTIDGSGNVSILTSGVALNAPVLQTTNADVATYTGTTPAIHSPASATMAFSMGGAERMRIDSSGNVGIGTDNPGVALDVNGGSNTQLRLTASDSSGGSIINFGDQDNVATGRIIYTHSSNSFSFKTNNVNDRLIIDSSGHVGIGATPTAWSSGYLSMQIGARGFVGAHTGSDLYLGQNAYFDSAWKYEASAAASLTQHSGGQITHFVAGSGTAGNAISWLTALHIKNDGKVGVGYNGPYAEFGVYRNQTDTYTPGSFLDQPTMELKHPSTNGGYNGIRYTNTAGNYEWFAGTNQNASNAADFVFQGYDRGGGTYKEMARIHDSGSITAPNQVGFRARGTRSAWIPGTTTAWTKITSANTGNAGSGIYPVGINIGGDNHVNGYNVGSCFNVSNGKFTAPIEGKYQVYGSIYCDKTNSTAVSYNHFLVYVNDQQVNEIYTIGGHQRAFVHDFSLNFSTILYLEAQDYVDWRIYSYDGNTRVYGAHCSIGAHLLS